MTEIKRCPVCHTVLSASAPEGFCPLCEFRRALDTPAAGDLSTLIEGPDSPSGKSTLPLADLKRIRYFGNFELLDEIASGGMGTVFKARQVTLNRVVALKLISAGVLASQDLVKRFKAEAEVAAGLNHAHIVPIHEIGEHDGRHYFSMTLIDGPTLAQALGRKPMAARRAAQLIVTLAHAVHYAHQRGVLHRDIKPSNVLLDAQGEPHLTDFGLAKLIQNESMLTHTNVVMGTPAYMSPEQARGDAREVTTATDVYGLGAILYESLTGTPPFGRGTSLETIRQVLDEEPRRPSVFNREVDRDLETICLKCLEKEPARRYATALGLAEDLDRWLRHEPTLARPVTALEKTEKWVRRKPAMAISLASALILLLIMAIGGPVMALRITGERTRAENNLYVADMRLAGQALADHDILHARERLQRISASPHQNKLRGWEYRYLMGRCHSGELMILGRHESWISDLALSSDDKWAASISEDGVVKLWDFATRKESRSWRAHTVAAKYKPDMPHHALAFSPDGQILATGGADKSVCLWNVSSPQRPIAEFENLNGACTHLAFSSDGGRLAGVSLNGQISLWNLSNTPPQLLDRWETKDWGTYAVAFSADEKNLVTAAAMQQIRLWDISEPRSHRPLPGLMGTTAPVGFSFDGRWLVAADSGAHFLRGWDYATRRERPHWPERAASISTLSFSPDGRLLASGLSDGEIVLWDFEGEREPVTMMGHEEVISGLAFSRGGQLLVSASYDKTVRLWDVSQKDSSERTVPHGLSAIGVCFSADSRYLASVARDRTPEEDRSVREQHTLTLWEVNSMTKVTSTATGGVQPNSWPTFAPDGHFIVADDWGTALKLYKVPSLEMITNLSGFAPAFSTDGNAFVYASGRRVVRRDSPALRSAVETDICEFPSAVASLALSPDGNTVACTVEEDGGIGIQFLDVRRRRRLGSITGHKGRVGKLAFSPDGKRLASAGWDGKVGIWDVSKRRLIKLMSGHNADLYSVAFSPDGQTLASCGEDSMVILWSASTWEEVAILPTKARLAGVAFSPDGQWLAAAANDGTVHVWHAPLWAELEAAGNHQGPKL